MTLLENSHEESTAIAAEGKISLHEHYLESLLLIERLHRRLLDTIKNELERKNRTDVNSIQALLIYNIGDSEVTAGELLNRGYYIGSNVSYNVKKLVEMNYLHHERSRIDKRSVRIKLTDAGQEIRALVSKLYERHCETLTNVGGISPDNLSMLNKSLNNLDRYWGDQIRYRL